EVRWVGDHLVQCLFEFLGGAKVMKGKDQCRPVTKALQPFGFTARGALQFDVEQLTTCHRSLSQYVQLRCYRTAKPSPIRCAPTSADSHHMGVVLHELLDPRDS